MSKANIMIIRDNDGHNIKVEGKATFECSSPIRNFSDNIASGIVKKITIDLQLCTWMDSTFMGSLATLGLHAKKSNITVSILNANKKNIKLIKELGIDKLFVFKSSASAPAYDDGWEDITDQTNAKNKVAKTVLEAHETLMLIDKKNINKFKKVVELVKKDIKTDSGN